VPLQTTYHFTCFPLESSLLYLPPGCAFLDKTSHKHHTTTRTNTATMGSVFLTHLHSAWHVDQAIMHEETRLVVMRFGSDSDPDCMAMVRRSPAPSSPFPT
jgi:hypothetical protein